MEKITHATIKDKVSESLRKAILDGKFKPGQALIQDQIAKELNVSRMPVREALRALEIEGLVTVSPFKGTVVTEHSPEDIREIYQIRMLLEGFAAEQAVPNMTPARIAEFERILDGMKRRLSAADYKGYAEYDRAFHHLIAESSGNRRLVKLIESTWGFFAPYIAYTIPGRIERSYREHTKIFDAIRRGKTDTAARLCREQIETVYREMAPYFQGHHRED
jgi:DNA-binding GntR family transcriptional regulator